MTKRDLFASVAIAASCTMALVVLANRVNAVGDLLIWPFVIAGWLSGSLHAPDILVFGGVLFVPIFLIAYGILSRLSKRHVAANRRL